MGAVLSPVEVAQVQKRVWRNRGKRTPRRAFDPNSDFESVHIFASKLSYTVSSLNPYS